MGKAQTMTHKEWEKHNALWKWLLLPNITPHTFLICHCGEDKVGHHVVYCTAVIFTNVLNVFYSIIKCCKIDVFMLSDDSSLSLLVIAFHILVYLHHENNWYILQTGLQVHTLIYCTKISSINMLGFYRGSCNKGVTTSATTFFRHMWPEVGYYRLDKQLCANTWCIFG